MRLISVLTNIINSYTQNEMILLFDIVNWQIKKSQNNKQVNHRNVDVP